MTDTFKVTVHMVSSPDGIIAKKDNDVSWFESGDHYEKGVIVDNTEGFMKTIDCFVMGSRTFELAMELSVNYGWAYGVVPTIVVSNRNLPLKEKTLKFIRATSINWSMND
ncbi:MAG: hypothetical protein ABIR66_05650 [Saprospiraceae bacterium]